MNKSDRLEINFTGSCVLCHILIDKIYWMKCIGMDSISLMIRLLFKPADFNQSPLLAMSGHEAWSSLIYSLANCSVTEHRHRGKTAVFWRSVPWLRPPRVVRGNLSLCQSDRNHNRGRSSKSEVHPRVNQSNECPLQDVFRQAPTH